MEDNELKQKVLDILKENSNTLDIEAHGTKSKLTFIGSMNYEDVVEKIAESLNKKSSP